ncbi:MAG: GNAT family N-acetyltransferase [bacterium]|nr:GNAT family N-acetyltransferase [bacterium]
MNFIIRPFENRDRNAVREISCETAFLEFPRENIFDDDEILADALTSYFTDHEPGAAFVAETDNRVVGYIIGSKNAESMKKTVDRKILPDLILKAIKRGVLLRSKNIKFLFYFLQKFLKGEFYVPLNLSGYPAVFHINIHKNFRNNGIGSLLILNYLDFLKKEGVRGVHFGTISEKSKNFFEKAGFTILFQSKRTYLKPYIGKDIVFYLYGKNIYI